MEFYGIYILESKGVFGSEYRVLFQKNIKNIYWINETGEISEVPIEKSVKEYFDTCEVFTNETEALVHAAELDKRRISKGFQLAYGIRFLRHPKWVYPLPERNAVYDWIDAFVKWAEGRATVLDFKGVPVPDKVIRLLGYVHDHCALPQEFRRSLGDISKL